MKGFLVLCSALLFCIGCASENDPGKWDELWKDLRGDNMQMRSNFTQTGVLDDRATTKSPN